jgi:hypothetical protein
VRNGGLPATATPQPQCADNAASPSLEGGRSGLDSAGAGSAHRPEGRSALEGQGGTAGGLARCLALEGGSAHNSGAHEGRSVRGGGLFGPVQRHGHGAAADPRPHGGAGRAAVQPSTRSLTLPRSFLDVSLV